VPVGEDDDLVVGVAGRRERGGGLFVLLVEDAFGDFAEDAGHLVEVDDVSAEKFFRVGPARAACFLNRVCGCLSARGKGGKKGRRAGGVEGDSAAGADRNKGNRRGEDIFFFVQG